MKRYIIITLVCFVSFNLSAQTTQVKVTLKSGVVLKGELKDLNPTEYVVVRIAGVDSKITMDKVDSIENLNSEDKPQEATIETSDIFDLNEIGKYSITDHSQRPESFELKWNGIVIKMLLVRGGAFNMGYNGKGSLRMDSEPMHRVYLSSYYISEYCINEETAYKLLGLNKKVKNRYYCDTWENAYQVVSKLAEQTQKPYRLLTEAEWEYASLMQNADEIWGTEKYLEWCSDYFAEFSPHSQTNPQGPAYGNRHVFRSYNSGSNKWDRDPPSHGDVLNKTKLSRKGAFFRIAISADAL